MAENQETVRFVFPKGHPREGETVMLNGIQFTEGVAEVPASHAKDLAKILTPYYGAAIEGSEDHERIEAEYAPLVDDVAAAREAKAKREEEEAAEAERVRLEQEAAIAAEEKRQAEAEAKGKAEQAAKDAEVAASKEAAKAAAATSKKKD